MSEIGKRVRIERIMDRDSGNTVIIPLDHGISVGPIKGLVDLPQMVNKVAKGGANAVLQQKGMVRHGHRGYGQDVGLIVHMSASTSLGPDPNNKVQVCQVEECLKMGADAVSVHINIGSETESDQLSILGCVSERCDFWGMPLVAMMYPRGKGIINPNDVEVVPMLPAQEQSLVLISSRPTTPAILILSGALWKAALCRWSSPVVPRRRRIWSSCR